MILCLDCGNTRLKWALYDAAGDTLVAGNLGHDDLATLGALTADFDPPMRILLANVAGPAVGGRLRAALGTWASRVEEIKSTAKAGGVTNFYENPGSLGVDRWCALIGARALTSDPCLVVMAGTATTLDLLDAEGHFLGGCILPGVDAMRRVLAAGTANLPLAEGGMTRLPRNTHDAIYSGILHAQAGAIERLYASVPSEPGGDKTCLLSGGYAGGIAGCLAIPLRLVENLPLLGLKALGLAVDDSVIL